eukprot:527163-Prorocentrum_minimum.AAC.1
MVARTGFPLRPLSGPSQTPLRPLSDPSQTTLRPLSDPSQTPLWFGFRPASEGADGCPAEGDLPRGCGRGASARPAGAQRGGDHVESVPAQLGCGYTVALHAASGGHRRAEPGTP